MNVLIVDDSPEKSELLTRFLLDLGVSGDKVHVSHCARRAREAVESRQFDLLLIDLILPASPRSEARADVGFELLQEFVEDGRGARIVGITANLEALETYADGFRQLAEQLLLIDGISQEWRDSLRSLVNQMTSRGQRERLYGVDFCFVSAVRGMEYKSVLDLPLSWGAEKVMANGSLYREATIELAGARRTGLAIHAKQMGMVAACHLTQSVIHEFRPRVLLMTGICGGLPGETSLGDLVIADKSWDWQSGKITDSSGFVAAPDQKEASTALVALCKSLEGAVLDITRELVHLKTPGTTPRFVEGPMLTGSSIVATAELHQIFVAQHRKPVAVDMEAYGFYYASRMSGSPAPDFLCIKAVSDQANAQKADDIQPFCSALSAKVGLRLLEKYFSSAR